MIPKLHPLTNGWGEIHKLNRKACMEFPDTPMMRSAPVDPKEGDQFVVGMYVKPAGVVAYVELENKFGIVDYKVVFCKLHPTEPDTYDTRRYERLQDAMKDFCSELMLDNPLLTQGVSSKMSEQYQDNEGFGKWA